jgi:hypothetical protein
MEADILPLLYCFFQAPSDALAFLKSGFTSHACKEKGNNVPVSTKDLYSPGWHQPATMSHLRIDRIPRRK